MSELRFDGRVAVVTGAGRGLGKAYALLLAARGAKVVVNDNGTSIEGDGSSDGPANSVVEQIMRAGGEAIASTVSVASAEGGQQIVDLAMSRYGRIDSLIHSAGITRPGPLAEMTAEDFEAVVAPQLHGAFHVVRPAFAIMCKAGFGRIVLTSSIGGVYGKYDVANYGVANAGVIGLANVAAIEGADHGVNCNILLPGAITRFAEGVDTTKNPPMTPEMVAPMAAWLAHETCSISGEILISIAGRCARGAFNESRGVARKDWTLEEIDAEMDKIRNLADPLHFPILPTGNADHVRYSFERARDVRKPSS